MRAIYLVGILVVCLLCAPALVRAQTLRFDDHDPVTFSHPAPARFPIHGMDAARFQTDIDWHRVRRAGVSFAFVKATEGGDHLDPKFRDHWHGAQRAGIPVGAYHFYYFCTSPQAQARWFIRNVPRLKGALPPVLDMEWNPHSPTCTKRPPAGEVQRQMRVFMRILQRHYGQRPIIYTTPGFFRDNALHLLRGEDFWLRSTARTPGEAYPGQAWTFWQYTGTGIVPGVKGRVDINAFAGSRSAWRRWLKARAH